jgi:hypothetical protein
VSAISGTNLADGVVLSDGVMVANGVILSDSTLAGMSSQSVQTSGDPTLCMNPALDPSTW